MDLGIVIAEIGLINVRRILGGNKAAVEICFWLDIVIDLQIRLGFSFG